MLCVGSSIALFFSYEPFAYVLLGFVVLGIILGLKLRTTITNRLAFKLYSISYIWLVVVVVLSVAKALRPHVNI